MNYRQKKNRERYESDKLSLRKARSLDRVRLGKVICFNTALDLGITPDNICINLQAAYVKGLLRDEVFMYFQSLCKQLDPESKYDLMEVFDLDTERG